MSGRSFLLGAGVVLVAGGFYLRKRAAEPLLEDRSIVGVVRAAEKLIGLAQEADKVAGDMINAGIAAGALAFAVGK